MTPREAQEIRAREFAATESNQLFALTSAQLTAHYKTLAETQRFQFGVVAEQALEERLDSIRREIELKRNQEQSDRQHYEAIGLGRQTLHWSKIAGIAGVIATVASVAALLKDTRFSSFLRAMSSLSTPAPPTSATVEPSPTPTAAESPSESPQASQTPAVTAAPK